MKGLLPSLHCCRQLEMCEVEDDAEAIAAALFLGAMMEAGTGEV